MRARAGGPPWWAPIAQSGAPTGALAGLIGGIASGWALLQIGTLPSSASLVRAAPGALGVAVHLAVATGLGAAFGLLVWRQRGGAGETLFWGLTYGTIVWFLGPLTVMPLLQIGAIAWDVHSAQEAVASLLAHLLYGAVAGLAMAALRRRTWDRHAMEPRAASLAGVITLGAIVGLAGSLVLRHTAAPPVTPGGAAAVAIAGGIALALLYPAPPDGTGPSLIRGMVFGFFWWFVWPVTIAPVAAGAGLAWSLDQVRGAFGALPGYLLYGAALALVYGWLSGLSRMLFSDIRPDAETESVGIEGVNATWRGAIAGLAGGIVFTGIMVRLDILPVIARLVGMGSMTAGLTVHLGISIVIGTTYGLFFRRQSFDLGSAIGWGVSYGFLWWVLGALTLMPRLLGGPVLWSAQAAAEAFGSLVGHIAYGAALGVVFHVFEARYSPWWLPITRAQEARIAQRKEQLLTSAPALWALVIVIALTLPLVLSP